MTEGPIQRPKHHQLISYSGETPAAPHGVLKFFDTPDFVSLAVDDRFNTFSVSWATELTPAESFVVLGEQIDEEFYDKSNLLLRTQASNSGLQVVKRSLSGIRRRIEKNTDRVLGFSHQNENIRISYTPGPPMFHGLEYNELTLELQRNEHTRQLARPLLRLYVEATAMSGFEAELEPTLNELAEQEEYLRL